MPHAAEPTLLRGHAGSCTADFEPDRLLGAAARALAAGAVADALAAAPERPRGHHLLGCVAMAMGQPAMALPPLQHAARLDPCFVHRMGEIACLALLGRKPAALARLEEAVLLMPATIAAHHAVADLFDRLAAPIRARDVHHAAAAMHPADATAQHAYGLALLALGEPDAAIRACEAAVAADGSSAAYHVSLSASLSFAGRFAEAAEAAEAATRLDPAYATAFHNLGHALLGQNRAVPAIAAYDRAIALDPDYADPRFGLATALLRIGDHERGWPAYEWRWACWAPLRTDLAVPAWQGEPPDGRIILVHGEQGLGDILQFVRFVPLLARRGARVVLQVPRSLVSLLGRMEGVVATVTDRMALPPFDLHCPIASLPLHLSIREDTIPPCPYLRRPPVPLRGAGTRVVGLVWAGAPCPAVPAKRQIDARRSIPPAALAPLLEQDGIRFVSVQYGADEAERGAAGTLLADALDGVADFAGTAERLAGLDLLISVDTSIVHLAGALDLPVWMLSRHDGCWRWGERGSSTAWYRSMRIFRQRMPGDWAGVIGEVCLALRHWASRD